MPKYRISKKIGIIQFEIFIEVDLDNFGNITSFKFYDGFYDYENPFDLYFSRVYCDDSKYEEWNFFLSDLLNLFESNNLFKKIKKEGWPKLFF